jgi:hypothetical protein
VSARHKIEISGKGACHTVKVDGHDIAGMLTSMDLHIDGEYGARLTVEMFAPADEVETEGRVRVSEPTRDALVKLGWTPPPEET